MRFKIGRFTGYKPDIDSIDVFKAIFIHVDRTKSYNANPSFLQKFFYKIKSEYPELFKDIYFNDDPWLAYSREIDWAYARTQEDHTTTRPNPDFYYFKISSNYDRLKAEIEGKFTDSQLEDLKAIATKFEEEIALPISSKICPPQ